MKSINLKKIIPTMALILLTIPMLTACGEPKFNEALTDKLEINAGNAKLIEAVPAGEAGNGIITAYSVAGDNIAMTEDNMVAGILEGQSTLHVVLINEKGKAAIKSINVTVLPATAQLIGSTSITVNGAPVNDGTGISTTLSNGTASLSYVNDKWLLASTDGSIQTYSVDDSEVLTLTESGELVINGKGTTRINVSTKSDKEIINNGWFEITVIPGHEHLYTEVTTEATCTTKGSKKEVCKEFNIETGAECGDVRNETEIPMKSHNYKEAGSKTEGTNKITTLKCSTCGATTTKTETIKQATPAPATSTNSGSGIRCTKCGSYNTVYQGLKDGNHGTWAESYRCNDCGKDDVDVWHKANED